MLGWDFFGQPFMFLMPDGDSEFKTILGAFCSVIVIILVLVYAYSKFFIFLNREDYIIQFQRNEEAFDSSFQFGFDDGFMVAAALIGGDLDSLYRPDPKYGELKFFLKTWDRESSI